MTSQDLKTGDRIKFSIDEHVYKATVILDDPQTYSFSHILLKWNEEKTRPRARSDEGVDFIWDADYFVLPDDTLELYPIKKEQVVTP